MNDENWMGEKADKMPMLEKIICWAAMIICALSVILIPLALLCWFDLQLDKLDYNDERLAFMRAYHPVGIPGPNGWKRFRRGQSGYKKWI